MHILHGRGIRIGSERSAALKVPLEVLPYGEKLILPICRPEEYAEWLLPEVGSVVSRFEPIAQRIDGNKKAWTSATGEIVGYTEKVFPNGSRWLCAQLQPNINGSGVKRKLSQAVARDVTIEELVQCAEEMNLIDETDGLPLADKLREWSENPLRLLVCDAVCDDPYNTDALYALKENADEVLSGLQLVMDACNCEKKVIVTYRKYSIGIAETRRLNRVLEGQRMLDITGKYPVWPKLARSNLLKAPYGRIGVQACMRLNRAFYRRRPPRRCIITVAGDCLEHSMNLSVLLGTRISEILKHIEKNENEIKVIAVGSAMNGQSVTDVDLPITQETRCLLLFSKNVVPHQSPCTGCGRCNEVCDANIFVSEAVQRILRNEPELAEDFGLHRCIGCAACSAVCPSGVPITRMLLEALNKTENEQKDGISVTEGVQGDASEEN